MTLKPTALELSTVSWQVHEKRAAMAAALEEPDSLADADDAMSTVSTAVTGLSAYTQRTHGPSAASTSRAGASTVGGKLPQGRHKVCLHSDELPVPLFCESERREGGKAICMQCAGHPAPQIALMQVSST